jgi:hypothetical protein
MVLLIPEHDRKCPAAPLLGHRREFQDMTGTPSRIVEELKPQSCIRPNGTEYYSKLSMVQFKDFGTG